MVEVNESRITSHLYVPRETLIFYRLSINILFHSLSMLLSLWYTTSFIIFTMIISVVIVIISFIFLFLFLFPAHKLRNEFTVILFSFHIYLIPFLVALHLERLGIYNSLFLFFLVRYLISLLLVVFS